MKELTRFIRDPFGEDEFGIENVLVEQVDVVSFGVCWIVIVREVTGEHCVEDDTARPDIDSGTDVSTILNDQFGSGVTRRTTGSRHEIRLRIIEAIGESEIGDDHVAIAVEEEVLEFEVSMNDSFSVKVRDSRDKLSEESGSISFLEVAMSEDVVE